MARITISLLYLLLLTLLLTSALGAVAHADNSFCLLCEAGWCARQQTYGGSCICVNSGSGRCETFGICWCSSNHCGCSGGGAEVRAQLHDYLKEHPGAHVSVAHKCKTGRRMVKDLEREFAANGVKLQVRYY